MSYISEPEFVAFQREVDERIRAHGVRVGHIESMFREGLDRLEKKIQSFDDKIDQLNKIISYLKDNLEIETSSLTDFVSAQRDINHKNEIDHKQIKNHQEKADRSHLDLSQIVERNCLHLSSVKAELNQLPELKSQVSDLYRKIGVIDSNLESAKKPISDALKSLKSQLEEVSSRLNALSAQQTKSHENIANLKKDHDVLARSVVENTNQLKGKIEEAREFLHNLIDSEMNEIFIPDVSHFIRDEDLIKLRHEINLITLEAKNAYAKSTNVELQNTINAKKLDHIQLKLNQLELAKQ